MLGRVSDLSIFQKSLRSLREGRSELNEIRDRVATGKRVSRPSDDPTATARIMRSSRRLRAVEQRRETVETARSRLRTEESALGDLTNILDRARQVAVSQGGDSATAQTRSVAKKEVDQLLAQAVQVGNTRFAGSFLFGGEFSDRAPFDENGEVPTGQPQPVGEREVEIGAGQRAKVNHDGKTVFLDSGAFDALKELSDALGADDQQAIQASVDSLTGSFEDVQDLIGEVGARTQRLEAARSTLDKLEVDVKSQKSKLEGASLPDSVLSMVDRQSSLRAAMQATARVIQLDLGTFLR